MKKNSTPKTPKTPSTQSSILSFFNRTPQTSTSLAAPVKASTSNISPNENIPEEGKKRAIVALEDDSPSPTTRPPVQKRRRVIIESDDDIIPEDNVPAVLKTPTSTRRREPPISSGHMSLSTDEPLDLDDKPSKISVTTPKTSRKVGSLATSAKKATPRSAIPKSDVTPARETIKKTFEKLVDDTDTEPQLVSQKTPKKKSMKKLEKDDEDEEEEEFAGDNAYAHEKFPFLKPENILDSSQRRPDDPDYDPKTLYVPPDFMKLQTPGHQQWWKFKEKFFDTVIFFKVGKFYELYHMDAVIGINNLDLNAMRGKYCHCGFPEIAYGKYSDMLVARGYKVARIEQTETPAMRDARTDGKAKEKVVRREICRITTTSTKTFGVYDGSDDKNFFLSVDPSSNYLMALVEEKLTPKISSYGLCFIDTSVGKFFLSQFEDDICRSTLRTLVANFQPTQILYPKGTISTGTQAIFNSTLSAVKKEALSYKKEFYPEDTVVKKLMDDEYLGSDLDAWPKQLNTIFDTTLHVPRSLPGKELAIRSLGGLMFYLQRCLIDVDMFSMKSFEVYRPPRFDKKTTGPTGAERWKGKNLILDGGTLLNLHLVPPYTTKKASATLRDNTALKFSLFNTIEACKTPFGKRLLRNWICSPSCDPKIISDRQDAIEYLMRDDVDILLRKMNEYLTKLPDLERLLQKIHTLGLKYRSQKHPDSRAQMFFPEKYNKRKINDLLTALNGFERISKLHTAYSQLIIDKCSMIERCIGTEFTDIREDLLHFERAFDRESAMKEGVILPRRGIVKEYDAALKKVDQCNKAVNDYADRMNKEYKTRDIKLFGKGKERFILEVPDNIASKLPDKFTFRSHRKGFRRYATPELTELSTALLEAENERDVISSDATRAVFADFADRNDKWSKVVSQIAILDCLASLAIYATKSKDLGFPMCRPQFDFDADEPYIEVIKGYHPLLIAGNAKLAKNATKFIPNDTVFGKINEETTAPLCILLTGPNMGGKSTLMRQVAVLIVFAQIGAFVPAKSMKLTPADRIFSRIGAHDASFVGQSTFYVELNETNSIIKNATRDSFVVIDELGRGTSTNDGTAIAGAVLEELAENIKCRTFFSTHYFALCDLVERNRNVKLAHMNFIVENENEDDPTEENVIFLYNLVDGPCKKSYGFFAAKLAGIPSKIVNEAVEAGQLLKEQQQRFKLEQNENILWHKRLRYLGELRQLCSGGTASIEEITNMIASM